MDETKSLAEAGNRPPAIGAPGNGTRTPFIPMKLVMQPGGLAVELTRPDTLVGRHLDVDLRLPLPDVSRRHCRFVYSDEGWKVMDLDSLNGIFLNNQRVEQSALSHGDMVRIGGFTFRVEIPEARSPVIVSRPSAEAAAPSFSSVRPNMVNPPKRKAS